MTREINVLDRLKNQITKEELNNLKNVQLLTREEIAKIYNTNETAIKRLLKFYEISSNKSLTRPIKNISIDKPITEYSVNTITKVKELENILHDKTSILNDLVGITNSHRYYFLKNGLTSIPKCVCGNNVKLDKEYQKKVFATYCGENCSRTWSKNSKETFDKVNDIEYLKSMRYDKGMSFDDMARELNVSTNKIIKIFEENNLDITKREWAESPNKDEMIKKKISTRGFNAYGEKYLELTNKELLKSLWDSGLTFKEIGKKIGVNPQVISYAFTNLGIEYNPSRWIENGTSVAEKELSQFIKEIYSGQVANSYRQKYTEYELDVYFPDKKLGIEFNGCYYHSEEYKDKNYHKNKMLYWNNLGIRVITIWEDDWEYNQEKTKNFLRNLLGNNTNRIGARMCAVTLLSHQDYCDFLEDNHMLGGQNSSIRLGLIYEHKLVSVMGFKKRDNTETQYTLTRFSNLNVNGAFTKLLKYFIRNYNASEIYSLADLEIVDRNNNVYSNNGFEELYEIPPDYLYFNSRTGLLEHKASWRKDTFSSLGYDINNKSESQLAKEHKLLKCYDSGKIMYRYIV